MAYWTGKGRDTMSWGGILEAGYFLGDGSLLTNLPGVTASASGTTLEGYGISFSGTKIFGTTGSFVNLQSAVITTISGAGVAVSGAIPILQNNKLALSGGTMTGSIVLSENDINRLRAIKFTRTSTSNQDLGWMNYLDSTNGLSLGNNSTQDPISFVTNTNLVKMFISNAGSVGIGTVTPHTILDVVGNINATGSIIAPNITSISGAGVTVSGAYVTTSGALVTQTSRLTTVSGAGVTVSGALYGLSGGVVSNYNKYVTTSGCLYVVSGAGLAVSGAYVATSGALYAHRITAGSHGVSGTNFAGYGVSWSGTNVYGTTISGATIITGECPTSGIATVLNCVYWSGTTPLTASNFPIGTLYIEYSL
jgi:hypothetical protein